MAAKSKLLDIMQQALPDGPPTSFLAHLYSTDPRSAEFYARFMTREVLESPTGSPFGLLLGEMSDLELLNTWQIAYASGEEIVVLNQLSKLAVPASVYLLIWAPQDGEFSQASAMAVIGQVKALLAMTLGRGVLIDKVAEFVVQPDGKLSFSGPVFRVPQPHDRRAFSDPAILGELSCALASAQGAAKALVQSALELAGRAILEGNETYAFILYWIALEQLAGGKAVDISTKLAAAYGESRSFVSQQLGLREIEKQRHWFVHKGKAPDLSHATERTLQALALDLARFRLDLPCRKLALVVRD